jgi:DNA-binding NarL/FixJ family response regulator
MRTLIMDDEPLARQRICTLLGDEKDIEVVGEAACSAFVVSLHLAMIFATDFVLQLNGWAT